MPIAKLSDAQSGGIIPDETWLEAELVAVTEKNIPKRDGGTLQKWLWKFVVTDRTSAFDGNVVYGETWPDFTADPSNVIRQWASELLNATLPVGYELNTDVLLGTPCRVCVGIREYEKAGEIRQVNEVTNVLRARDAQFAAAANADPSPF